MRITNLIQEERIFDAADILLLKEMIRENEQPIGQDSRYNREKAFRRAFLLKVLNLIEPETKP